MISAYFRAHSDHVRAVSPVPVANSGLRRFLTGSYDGTAKLHEEVAQGVWNERIFVGHTAAVTAIVPVPPFSDSSDRESTLVVSASFDGTVRVWSLSDAAQLSCTAIHQDKICTLSICSSSLATVPQSALLVTGSWDTTAVVCALDLGAGAGVRVLCRLEGHAASVLHVAWCGTDILTSGADGKLLRWSPSGGTTWTVAATFGGTSASGRTAEGALRRSYCVQNGTSASGRTAGEGALRRSYCVQNGSLLSLTTQGQILRWSSSAPGARPDVLHTEPTMSYDLDLLGNSTVAHQLNPMPDGGAAVLACVVYDNRYLRVFSIESAGAVVRGSVELPSVPVAVCFLPSPPSGNPSENPSGSAFVTVVTGLSNGHVALFAFGPHGETEHEFFTSTTAIAAPKAQLDAFEVCLDGVRNRSTSTDVPPAQSRNVLTSVGKEGDVVVVEPTDGAEPDVYSFTGGSWQLIGKAVTNPSADGSASNGDTSIPVEIGSQSLQLRLKAGDDAVTAARRFIVENTTVGVDSTHEEEIVQFIVANTGRVREHPRESRSTVLPAVVESSMQEWAATNLVVFDSVPPADKLLEKAASLHPDEKALTTAKLPPYSALLDQCRSLSGSLYGASSATCALQLAAAGLLAPSSEDRWMSYDALRVPAVNDPDSIALAVPTLVFPTTTFSVLEARMFCSLVANLAAAGSFGPAAACQLLACARAANSNLGQTIATSGKPALYGPVAACVVNCCSVIAGTGKCKIAPQVIPIDAMRGCILFCIELAGVLAPLQLNPGLNVAFITAIGLLLQSERLNCRSFTLQSLSSCVFKDFLDSYALTATDSPPRNHAIALATLIRKGW